MAFPPELNITDGATVLGAAWGNAFDADLHSALKDTTSGGGAGSSQTPAVTTAEVRDARDGEASLSAKLLAMENAFTGVGPSAVRNGLVLGNAIANGTFLMWPAGDAAAPAYWTLNGTGAAVARTGVGLADTTALSTQDHFAARITYGSDPAYLSQFAVESGLNMRSFGTDRLIPTDKDGNPLPGYEDTTEAALWSWLFSHVWSDGSNRARIRVRTTVPVDSEYHPGDSVWHSLVAGPLQITSGSQIEAQLRVEATGAAHFQAVSLIFAPAGVSPMYVPEVAVWRTERYYVNNPATGTLSHYTFARPRFIVGAQMSCLTAGGGTAPTCDLLTNVGGVFVSLFTTLPTIAVGQLQGATQVCDPAAANYRRRTIMPGLTAAAALSDNTILRLDYVDDGGGALRDLFVTIHSLEFVRPLELFRGMGSLG